MYRALGSLFVASLVACNSLFGIPDVTQTSDVCGVGLATCDANATCTNTSDGFMCTCNAGFTGDGTTCADVDECAASSPCDVHASCANTPGSFTCTCDDGYGGDGAHCAPSTFTKLAVAGDSTCGIGGDGALYCWGGNGLGQLGDGTNQPHAWPARVGTATNWSDVSAMFLKVCATNKKAETYCWGLGAEGELGNGATMDSPAPVEILYDQSSGRSVLPIAVGRHAVCGIVSAVGSSLGHPIDCWGEDDTSGTPVFQATPQRKGFDQDWLAVGVGTVACGLRSGNVADGAGTLWCWGASTDPYYGETGQLGLGDATTVSVDPAQVGTARWKALALGYFNACGIQSDGSLWCWGNNPAVPALQYGMAPTQIGNDTGWTAVSVSAVSIAGIDHGMLQVWGDNSNGELGLASFTGYATPQPFSAMPTGWTQISAGNSSICGLQGDGSAYCWGDILDGNLGNGATVDELVPTRVNQETYAQTTTGNITCAVTTGGRLECWGFSPTVGIGTGSLSPLWAPTQVTGGTWSEVATSAAAVSSTCAIASGALSCWGDNSFGQLGVSSAGPVLTPASVPAPAGVAWAHVAIAEHTCAISTVGALYCWGDDKSGQLGDGGTANSSTPVQVAGTWRAVSVGEIFNGQGGTCAIDQSGALKCWGLYLLGVPAAATPTTVASGSWASVSEGVFELCAVNAGGQLWCGGTFSGNDSTTGGNAFAKVGGASDWRSVSVGQEICAIKTDGTLWCFANSGVQLGNGYAPYMHGVDDPYPAPQTTYTPTQIGSDRDWASVDTRGSSCATKVDGSLWCWGASAATVPQLTAAPTRVP